MKREGDVELNAPEDELLVDSIRTKVRDDGLGGERESENESCIEIHGCRGWKQQCQGPRKSRTGGAWFVRG